MFGDPVDSANALTDCTLGHWAEYKQEVSSHNLTHSCQVCSERRIERANVGRACGRDISVGCTWLPGLDGICVAPPSKWDERERERKAGGLSSAQPSEISIFRLSGILTVWILPKIYETMIPPQFQRGNSKASLISSAKSIWTTLLR